MKIMEKQINELSTLVNVLCVVIGILFIACVVLIGYSTAKLEISTLAQSESQKFKTLLDNANANFEKSEKDVEVLVKVNSELANTNSKLQQTILDRDKERVELHTDLSKTIGDLQLELKEANGKIAGHNVQLEQEREVIKRKDIIIEDLNNRLNHVKGELESINVDKLLDSTANKKNGELDSLQLSPVQELVAEKVTKKRVKRKADETTK